MPSPTAPTRMTLGDLERSKPMTFILWKLASCKEAELWYLLLLNKNRILCMSNATVPLNLTFTDLDLLHLYVNLLVASIYWFGSHILIKGSLLVSWIFRYPSGVPCSNFALNFLMIADDNSDKTWIWHYNRIAFY